MRFGNSATVLSLASCQSGMPCNLGAFPAQDNVGLKFCAPGFPRVYLYRLNGSLPHPPGSSQLPAP